MKKVLFIVCCIFCLGRSSNNKKTNLNYINKKRIRTNLEQISKVTDNTSSNPFDYKKMNTMKIL